MSVPIVIIMLWFDNILKNIPGMRELASLIDLVLLLIPIAIIYMVISSDNQKRFNELRRDVIDKLLSGFNQQEINESCYQKFVGVIEEMIADVEDELAEETKPYHKDIKVISTETKNFQLEGQKIKKILDNQLEILKSE
jgi:hypothetical protein